MHHAPWSRALWLVPLTALIACGAEPPDNGSYDGGPAADGAASLMPDGFAGCPDPTSLPLTLDSPPTSVCGTTAALRGSAPGAQQIVAETASGAAAPVAVGASGSFCIEVALQGGSANQVKLYAVDENGCPGQPALHLITQKECQPDDQNAGGESNRALGSTVSASNGPDEGSHQALVDGQPSTEVAYKAGWGISDANVRLDIALPKPVQPTRIVVRWRDSDGDGCDFAREYRLYTSVAATPGEVSTDNDNWTLVKDISDGKGGIETFNAPSATPIQHVALQLNNNACSSWSERFVLQEVEVWGEDLTVTASPATCGN